MKEIASWGPQGSNTYRVSSQGQGVFNAPDLEISTAACPADLTLKARIKNLGSQGVPAGGADRFYFGTEANGPLILTAASTKPLLPGASDVVTATFPVASAIPPYELFAAVDAGAKIDECNGVNNSTQAGGIACPSED